jgi:3-deoxy-D-manno-octulosonate 8-phosphate phosphatase (KDO 8-P phosphatase)
MGKIEKRLEKIKLLLLDVDGVLTNGEIVYDHQGKEIKVFNVRDGFGIVMLRKQGLKTAVLTARFCEAVKARMEDLGVDRIIQDAQPKLAEYDKLIKELGVNDEQVCFVADDLTDMAVFKRVGAAIAVPNAVGEIKSLAHHVTQNEGGKGAVREVVELILKAQGRWDDLVQSFS